MQKKMGEDDPALLEEIGRTKLKTGSKHEDDAGGAERLWKQWDTLVGSGRLKRTGIASATRWWMC